MGGNVWEWSTETNSSDIPGSCRGGDYGCSSSVYSAGFRYSYQDKAFEYVGFRIALLCNFNMQKLSHFDCEIAVKDKKRYCNVIPFMIV